MCSVFSSVRVRQRRGAVGVNQSQGLAVLVICICIYTHHLNLYIIINIIYDIATACKELHWGQPWRKERLTYSLEQNSRFDAIRFWYQFPSDPLLLGIWICRLDSNVGTLERLRRKIILKGPSSGKHSLSTALSVWFGFEFGLGFIWAFSETPFLRLLLSTILIIVC